MGIMGLSYETIIAYLFILIFAIILIAILMTPLKWLWRIIVSLFLGFMGLIAFNYLGHFINFTIGINPASILTIGFLGIPGFMLLVFLRYFLK